MHMVHLETSQKEQHRMLTFALRFFLVECMDCVREMQRRLQARLDCSYDETDVMIISTDGIIYPALPCPQSASEHFRIHPLVR